MIIKDVKIAGNKVYIVFNGKAMIFRTNLEGIIAVVDKCTNSDIHPEDEEYFTIYTGNTYCLGSSLSEDTVQIKVQACISKLFKPKKCYFIERRGRKLNSWHEALTIIDETNKIIL